MPDRSQLVTIGLTASEDASYIDTGLSGMPKSKSAASLTPRGLLARAREALALPSLDVYSLDKLAFAEEAFAICQNYGIQV